MVEEWKLCSQINDNGRFLSQLQISFLLVRYMALAADIQGLYLNENDLPFSGGDKERPGWSLGKTNSGQDEF
ncbi:hypothetical protein C5167_049718 [Papaver somniferum]|uniref:Uncharacterized protein n=1 Tax=Papaver somniferum TaxID=3469 RepID=A0A4Y7KMZ3_PAPSO|nr:hypothetical protein C5167_049718 [Papaver somniferum]